MFPFRGWRKWKMVENVENLPMLDDFSACKLRVRRCVRCAVESITHQVISNRANAKKRVHLIIFSFHENEKEKLKFIPPRSSAHHHCSLRSLRWSEKCYKDLLLALDNPRESSLASWEKIKVWNSFFLLRRHSLAVRWGESQQQLVDMCMLHVVAFIELHNLHINWRFSLHNVCMWMVDIASVSCRILIRRCRSPLAILKVS